jgi:hypothetical protein
LFEEDENTVPGTETQKLIKIYSNDACTQTDIPLPLLNSMIETNNYFKFTIPDITRTILSQVVSPSSTLFTIVKGVVPCIILKSFKRPITLST